MEAGAVVVVVICRGPEFIGDCLAHLREQTVEADRIVVVDESEGGIPLSLLEEVPSVEYRRNWRGADARSSSHAVAVAGAEEEFVAFIDDHAYARTDWLELLLEPYVDPAVGAVGGREDRGESGREGEGVGEVGLLLPSGRLTEFFSADPERTVDVDHLAATNMSVRLSVMAASGGSSHAYRGRPSYEQTESTLRARRAGYRIVYEPRAVTRRVSGTPAEERGTHLSSQFLGARDHIVLLSSVFGWRHTIMWRGCRSIVSDAIDVALAGARSALGRNGGAPLPRVQRALEGSVRAVSQLCGAGAGMLAAMVLPAGRKR